jgi:hypothetical protein
VIAALPNPAERPTLDIEEAGKLLGLGRSKAYAEARKYLATNGAQGLPCIAFGRTLRAPTAPVLRLLGVDPVEARGANVVTMPQRPATGEAR